MSYALQWLRSLIYVVQIYFMMLPIGIVFLPWALVSRAGAIGACKTWSHWAIWSARWMVGIRTDVRGTPPQGEVMIAAKHQSFFDIIVLVSAVPRPRFIMKQELVRTPIVGWFALRIGCIPVDRGKRGKAITKMLQDVGTGAVRGGQLIIYPQGTRVAPGATPPYKSGTAILYRQIGQPCVPAAVNVGVFWPRHSILRKPGLAVVEFLPEIPPGMTRDAFLPLLTDRIATASDALMREAGFPADHDTRQLP